MELEYEEEYNSDSEIERMYKDEFYEEYNNVEELIDKNNDI